MVKPISIHSIPDSIVSTFTFCLMKSGRLSFGQNCTVGNNKGIYPTLGINFRMCANSTILGNCHVGDNVTLGAGALVKDQDIPSNSLVFGQSPNLVIKQKK